MNHDGMVWVGRGLKDHPVPRGTSHQPSLPRAHPALKHPQGKFGWLSLSHVSCSLAKAQRVTHLRQRRQTVTAISTADLQFIKQLSACGSWQAHRRPGGLLLLAERFQWLRTRGPPGITGNDIVKCGSITQAMGVTSQAELLPAAVKAGLCRYSCINKLNSAKAQAPPQLITLSHSRSHQC